MREKNMDCDAAFDEWYAGQRHQLANEELCRLIWREGWMGAESEWRGPLQDCEIAMVATYAPEGVTDDDVAVIVRKVEQMHGLRHNAEIRGGEAVPLD